MTDPVEHGAKIKILQNIKKDLEKYAQLSEMEEQKLQDSEPQLLVPRTSTCKDCLLGSSAAFAVLLIVFILLFLLFLAFI